MWFGARTTPLVRATRVERDRMLDEPLEPHGGPSAYPMLLQPAAIAAGLGELGEHGSLINPTLGSNLRLACGLTDATAPPWHRSR